jgi:hypothetical protein
MASSVLNSDDGVISGTAGLKSVGGDDGVLVFQSKGTETARINTDSQIVAAAGTASLPALTTTGDVNTGIFFPAADTIAFAEGGVENVRFDSNGKILAGTTSSFAVGSGSLQFSSDTLTPEIALRRNSASSGSVGGNISFYSSIGVTSKIESQNDGANSSGNSRGRLLFFTTPNASTTPAERMRIDSSGDLYIGTTQNIFSGGSGINIFGSSGQANFATNGANVLYINRNTNDGDLIQFYQALTQEGSISVSGTTVSYNGGHLSRWAQMLTKPDLLKGTVMSNLDEMNVYIAPTTYWTEEDELPEGVNVGDVKVETHEVQNEQLNKVKVSDVEGDANVAGVFVNWDYDEAHQVDEINMAMTGDMIIRIAQGTTVARGDLLMSAGDGTAKPQGDDIVRSKTIAKVTSTHVTCTYDDGSYCVPCVLMAC